LNLVDGKGNEVNPATAAQVKSFLLGATATNMSNMLSAQLAAMKLNVLRNGQSDSALVHAPYLAEAGDDGFITVAELITAANNALPTGDRAHQEALKNALDAANNNTNFLLPSAPATPF
jgi:hypothetical protein